MNPTRTHQTENASNEEKQSKVVFFILPLFVLIPVIIGVLFQGAGIPLVWRGLGLGAIGWMVALVLRAPVGLLATKLYKKETANLLVVGSSGPLEELIRLGLLLVTATGFSWSASVGQGWAGIEVLYAILNGLVVQSLLGRTDEKAMQAKAMLASQGMLGHSPVWGFAERISASAYHIGATFLIASSPWFVLILIPFHSALNLGTLKILKKSIALAEGFIALLGLLVFIVGVVLIYYK